MAKYRDRFRTEAARKIEEQILKDYNTSTKIANIIIIKKIESVYGGAES